MSGLVTVHLHANEESLNNDKGGGEGGGDQQLRASPYVHGSAYVSIRDSVLRRREEARWTAGASAAAARGGGRWAAFRSRKAGVDSPLSVLPRVRVLPGQI